MIEPLTLAALKARLEQRGHAVFEPEQTVSGFNVWPDADTVITVAVEPDGTLYPQYTERFFLGRPARLDRLKM
jgi:hypothetical protein